MRANGIAEEISQGTPVTDREFTFFKRCKQREKRRGSSYARDGTCHAGFAARLAQSPAAEGSPDQYSQ